MSRYTVSQLDESDGKIHVVFEHEIRGPGTLRADGFDLHVACSEIDAESIRMALELAYMHGGDDRARQMRKALGL